MKKKPLNVKTVKERIKNGVTLEEISNEFGYSKSAVSKFCKKYHIETNPPGRKEGVSDKDLQKNAGTFLEEFYKIIQNRIA